MYSFKIASCSATLAVEITTGGTQRARALQLPQDAGHQVGIGFAEADAGITQGNFLII